VDFCRNIKVSVLSRVDLIPFINMIFLVVVFFFLLFVFAINAPLNVRLPKAVTSDMANDKSITIVVTSENIVYVNGRVTTSQELRALLSRAKNRTSSVLIKADRRASVGRIVDIWNLGRDLGIKRVNVATDQEE
jgi:biopolymer transport protein ExbD